VDRCDCPIVKAREDALTLVDEKMPTAMSRELDERENEARGFHPIGRWVGQSDERLTGHHLSVVPGALVSAVNRLADRLGVPIGTLVTAVHARVLRSLTGSTEVATGVRTGGRAIPSFRLQVADASWRDLVEAVHRSCADVRRSPAVPAEGASPLFEVVLDLGVGGDGIPVPPDDVVLVTRLRLPQGGPGWLRLDYSRGAIDNEYAARIAGYYVRALTLLSEDVDAEHHTRSLLSEQELRLQLDGLAGPERDLPDRRAHELFEQQVRATPDAVAAVCGDRTWTYDRLNREANMLAHALLRRGVTAEAPVAVALDRDLEWLAAVLAVFKAGGVYLPIEPQFPAQRITSVLSRSGCRLVISDARHRAGLQAAIGAADGRPELLCIGEVSTGQHVQADLGVAVEAGQLAYIYFTSGSTGQPKGAMCEHAGMLNHLFAKIDDLGIGPGQAVAQTAPQCFDISLWQLLAALLVGGRTVIVRQDEVVDVDRLAERIVTEGVEVVQLVPSYIEVLLGRREQPGTGWGRVRCVSATGEALQPDLVRRWFARYPGIALVNAYGLTETSDDTNHEVLTAPPAADRVPLGRVVNNVRVYVVDEHLQPVPLGAPGEIVFSGVCVGRGYVNDEERTRAAFGTDPFRPGERLYRSGDFGHWLPGGTLAFLGRRDAQVKIRGFRIELGEVENQMFAVPAVREAAVVVCGAGSDAAYLAGAYVSDDLDAQALRAALHGRLPDYMIPTVLVRLDRLPLTENGKTDHGLLRQMAVTPARVPPATPTEIRLAEAWATVLRIPVDQISRNDDFFGRGGTSLTAVRLILALDRKFSMKDLVAYPVLADLASALDESSQPALAGP
jgi:amino acid adenylation domain-containing protein